MPFELPAGYINLDAKTVVFGTRKYSHSVAVPEAFNHGFPWCICPQNRIL